MNNGKIRNNLVLDVPPGIGLLGMAFEQEGYCVVNGPDLLWGRDMRGWHPVKGAFEGIIGGPPCKGESKLRHLCGNDFYSLSEEFMRIISEAQPDWWVMEAVIRHEAPFVLKLTPRWLGEKQSRVRYFHSNLNLQPFLEVSLFDNPIYKPTVVAGHDATLGQRLQGHKKYTWGEMLELQGLPEDFNLPFFTKQKAHEAVGNGVPLPMGHAIAKAVRKSLEAQNE